MMNNYVNGSVNKKRKLVEMNSDNNNEVATVDNDDDVVVDLQMPQEQQDEGREEQMQNKQKKKKNICFLSSYHTGSHKAHITGYSKYTEHNLTVFTLEGKYWKHRMNMGSLSLAEKFIHFMKQKWEQDPSFYFDLIIATDMVDLASFVAQCRRVLDARKTCLITYMHENQLTYPVPSDTSTGVFRRNNGQREPQFVLLNYKSQMSSDFILFNSQFHMDSWYSALPKFLNQNRDEKMLHTVEELKKRSRVLHVGIELSNTANDMPCDEQTQMILTDEFSTQQSTLQDATISEQSPLPPLIIWNQRWEYDKAPLEFVKALQIVSSSKRAKFRVAICGETFHLSDASKQQFEKEIEPLKDYIVHCGYAPWDKYQSLLDEAVCTISTAQHEFFGISIVETIYHHCFPILPNRLSYPELIPQNMHNRYLYKNMGQLIEKLVWVLNNESQAKKQAKELAEAMNITQYDWKVNMATQYDKFLSNLYNEFLTL